MRHPERPINTVNPIDSLIAVTDSTPLRLPPVRLQLRRLPDGAVQVFDPLRRRWVAYTPEERVRQHFVAFLAGALHYPPGRMANEVSLSHNGRPRRCDTVIYDASAHPVAIIEYKAPSVAITANVFDQILRYNMVLGTRWIIVSNGIDHYCCKADPSEPSGYRFHHDIPSYIELLES